MQHDDDNHSYVSSWVHYEDREMPEEPTQLSITPLINKMNDLRTDLQSRIRPNQRSQQIQQLRQVTRQPVRPQAEQTPSVMYPSTATPDYGVDPPHRSELKRTIDFVLTFNGKDADRQRPTSEIDLSALFESSENTSYLLEKVKVKSVGSTAKIPLRLRIDGVPNKAVLAVDNQHAPSSDFCFTVPPVKRAEVNTCLLKRSQQEIDTILNQPLVDVHTLNRVLYNNKSPDLQVTMKTHYGASIVHILVKQGTPEYAVVYQYLVKLNQFNINSVLQGGGDLLVDEQNVKDALEAAYRWYQFNGPKNVLRIELDHDGNTFITEPSKQGTLKSSEAKSTVHISLEVTWTAVNKEQLRKLRQ
jgi:hypothetical protein